MSTGSAAESVTGQTVYPAPRRRHSGETGSPLSRFKLVRRALRYRIVIMETARDLRQQLCRKVVAAFEVRIMAIVESSAGASVGERGTHGRARRVFQR